MVPAVNSNLYFVTAALVYFVNIDAMAPKVSRPHPYRATSDVETLRGIQHASWLAGPGCLPAGIHPPPDRPIFDHCELLQEEQSLCFLKALQNIHFGHPRITFSSPFCVAGVGRSIITLF